jgi:hypothetical protein
MLPGEEGQDRTGLAGLVAVVEVIGAGVVEVDGLLDQAQPENAGVKVEVALGRAGDGGHVMDAVLDHCGVLLKGQPAPRVCSRDKRVPAQRHAISIAWAQSQDCFTVDCIALRKESG